MKKLFMLGVIAALVSGCSNNEDDYLEIIKCNLSAQRLSQTQALYEITSYAQEFTRSTGFLPDAEEIKKIALEGREKLGLDKLDSQETHELMVEIYNSSTCKKMHKQSEFEG